MKFPSGELKRWFARNKRSFPWRIDPSPYRVFVSEVMLQQTQAQVVVPYFERWMDRFPTIEALAKATEEEVIKAWEGLGYYSRARNLHAAAKHALAYHGGELPSDLAGLPGIGPYTRGAIRSFAFKMRSAAVDGNVMRVLTRFFAIEDDISQTKTQRKLWEIAEAILPEEEPWVVSEALIELGALVCRKKPTCSACPLQRDCVGQGLELPVKRPLPKTTLLIRHVGIICSGDLILVEKRGKGKVMADLYEFPYTENEEKLAESLDLPLTFCRTLKKERHTFTRYRACLIPHLFMVAKPDPRYEWVYKEELETLPFSSGHRRLLKQL